MTDDGRPRTLGPGGEGRASTAEARRSDHGWECFFVADSCDKEIMGEAQRELRNIAVAEDRIQKRCEAPNISRLLGLEELVDARDIQPCAAVTAEGLYEGFSWYFKTLCSNQHDGVDHRDGKNK